MPQVTQIVGYARSPMDDDALRERLRPFLKGDAAKVAKFLAICTYLQGEVRACMLCCLARWCGGRRACAGGRSMRT